MIVQNNRPDDTMPSPVKTVFLLCLALTAFSQVRCEQVLDSCRKYSLETLGSQVVNDIILLSVTFKADFCPVIRWSLNEHTDYKTSAMVTSNCKDFLLRHATLDFPRVLVSRAYVELQSPDGAFTTKMVVLLQDKEPRTLHIGTSPLVVNSPGCAIAYKKGDDIFTLKATSPRSIGKLQDMTGFLFLPEYSDDYNPVAVENEEELFSPLGGFVERETSKTEGALLKIVNFDASAEPVNCLYRFLTDYAREFDTEIILERITTWQRVSVHNSSIPEPYRGNAGLCGASSKRICDVCIP